MNPFIPIPSVLDRSAGYVALQFRNDPTILGYRIRVANTLMDAYGTANGIAGAGTFALFDVDRGRSFISRTLRIRGTSISGDITRGQSRAYYDPNEYVGLDPVVPSDNQFAFMRIQTRTVASPIFPVAADNTNQSEILILRDPSLFTVPNPAITLGGTAPNLATAVAGAPAPPEALIFRLPSAGATLMFMNLAGTPILLATGRNQPLMSIGPMESFEHQGGLGGELVICANGANPAFSVLIALDRGVR